MPKNDPTTRAQQPDAITGIHAMQGHGVTEAKGFWADAWSQVVVRPGAILALTWIALITALAIFAPVIANGHPAVMHTLDAQGNITSTSSPLREHLSQADWFLMIAAVLAILWMGLALWLPRSKRLGILLASLVQGGIALILAAGLKSALSSPTDVPWLDALRQRDDFSLIAAAACALVPAILFAIVIPTARSIAGRSAFALAAAAVAAAAIHLGWTVALPNYDYHVRENANEIRTTYTLIPWSPAQRFGDRNTKTKPPGTSSGQALILNLTYDLDPGPLPQGAPESLPQRIEELPLTADERAQLADQVGALFQSNPAATREDLIETLDVALASAGRVYHLGSDENGQDVLSQLIHASRLALSVGFVATSIAVLIGVTMGALMGYFGGIVDLFLYRVVEIFMSIPVLIILIVASAVLPRNMYVMMAIIGCFTWQTVARFARAEFYKLRNQDFVQSAQAVGLPLHSILFKHMLPNGVTPVLVDASFLVAAAILYESFISFLGLGPADQPSWGKLLADATGETGAFSWWLAIFPGFAIFLTVLAYNLLGEALRDAIDPKLKKARV